MYVKDSMTRAPFTITKDVVVSKAIDIMAKNGFHRLPVVDEEGHLIGLITEGLVSESSGSKTTSLSIYELNYILSKTKVEEIMIKDVKTVSPDVFLEEAADRMAVNGVSVLPVVDDENKVLGIITEKDIFKAFVNLTGFHHQGTRFVVKCVDQPGEFAQIAALFAKENANLESLGVYHSERGTECMIKATGEVSVETMIKELKEAGFELTNVVQTTKDGDIVKYSV